jgi:PKD repeat protein
MKKTLTLLFCSALLLQYAQEDYFHCGTDEAMRKEFELHPELYKEFLDREAILEQQDAYDFANGYQSANKTAMPPVYTIPVVFHILHQYGSENISDAQIYDELAILNRDFRKLNPDTTSIVAAFKSIAADAEIEFKLATIDPNGNCTDGIVRHVDANTNWPNSSSAYAYTWPRNKYLNIYVVKTISSGAAGYTYLPGTTLANSDAIVILHSYVGSIGTGSASTSRALTHEIGHWLNLQHVWGSTNNPGVSCGNDNVTDTPVTKGYTSCALSNCSICNSAVEENVQNFMEYSYCSRMFSAGQKTRMRTALTSSTASRNNLWTTSNLAATGVSPVGSPCAPVADFKANTSSVCTNVNVTFYDLSWNGQATSWSWSFPGGNPATSTDSMPVVQYSTPGTYAVTLTVGNAQGSDAITKTSYITVYNNVATYQGPWVESFETSSIPNADWTINNSSGGVTWTRTSNAAVTGSYSMYLQNTSNTALSTDEAISPSVNVSLVSGATLKFKVAYAQKNASQNDYLKVYSSTNCGQTWTQRYNKSGQTLQTLGSGVYQSSAFTPNANQWRQESISINGLWFSPNVIFKFVFICDSSTAGNNIYLEDINIDSPSTGIADETDNTINFFVSPNPSNGQAFVNFNLVEKTNVTIEVMDMLGRKLENISNASFDAGEYRLPVGVQQSYAPGIYFVNLKVGARLYSTKMVID